MKTFLLINCFLVLTLTCYGQQNHHSKSLSYEDYLKKSNDQKSTGWVMLSGGILMMSIGTLIITGKGVLAAGEGDAILPLLGFATTIGSIPFFMSSGNNKRKAATIRLENQPAPVIGQNHFFLNAHPALTVKIVL